MTEHKNITIGIDLGTTNSEVSIIQDGIPKIIKIDGSAIMPSVVSFQKNGDTLVGQQAINNAVAAPESTIFLIKRKMGKNELIEINGKSYSPQMISSIILQRLKIAAEEYLKQPVTQAVITVPAYFDELQREATKEAAELAGLEVLRLLNEPTSAALCYALGQKRSEIVLVYDLGGGTFDVSIVDLSSDVMEVRASHGDNQLGGSDFDRMIYEAARQKIQDEHGFDIETDMSAKIRLLTAAEAAKIHLSNNSFADINEEFLFQHNGVGHHFSYRINRVEFEHMIRPSLEKTINSIKQALSQANCQADAIDRVILVGGSTKIPLVSQMIQDELNIVPQCGMNPDTVVALGAAIEAANLSGEKLGSYMVDITPHSFGIETLGTFFGKDITVLIHKNTPLPATGSKVFFKCVDSTNQVSIKAYQGESPKAEDCRFLGTFDLENLSEQGKPEILVKFELNRNGILNVTATEVSSGISTTHTMKRIKSSDFKKENLADLGMVRLKVNEEKSMDEEDLLEVENTFETITKICLSPELEEKVKKLLDNETLELSEKEDLKKYFDEALKGEKEALEKLEELVYFME